MLEESLESLALRGDGIYVDATLGGGGYAEAILDRAKSARVFGFDTDPAAQRFASNRLARFGARFVLVPENFGIMAEALSARGITAVDGIVFDLGVSSHQLDTDSIGLSYRIEAPLDMRLDPRLKQSAAEVIASYDESQLAQIFRAYGEERFAGQIARKIVQARTETPVGTTTQLASVITNGLREDKRNETLSRIFQALRIEVNDELGNLRHALEQVPDLLRDGGRIVVVSYHSLEDRIAKEFFRRESAPRFEPGSLGGLKESIDIARARLRLLTRKPVAPSREEVERNPRARSARLRATERMARIEEQ